MQKDKKTSLFYTVVFVLITVSTTACAGKPVMVPIDRNAKLVIAVDKNGEVIQINGISKEGKVEKVGKCALCSQDLAKKFGGHCEALIKDKKLRHKVFARKFGKKDANLPICSGTTRATITGLSSINLLVTHKNPHCIIKIKDGDEIVFVYPPDCLIN